MKKIPRPSNFMLMCAAAVLLNWLLSTLNGHLALPLYMDSVGTVFCAMTGGYMQGILVGFLTNLILAVRDPSMIYYACVNVLLAVAVTFLTRRGIFASIRKTIISIPVIALCTNSMGILLTWSLNVDQGSSNVRKSVAFLFFENYRNNFFTGYLAELMDKGIAIFLALVIIMLIRRKNKGLISTPFVDALKASDLKDKDNYGTRKHSLRTRMAVVLSVGFLGLAGSLLVTGIMLYRNVIINDRIRLADGVTDLMCQKIDPDRISDYLIKGRSAPGYVETENELYLIMNSYPDIEYLYVYRILEDGCHVVFDLDTPEWTGDPVGSLVDFDQSFEQYLPRFFAHQSIDPVISDDSYGYLLTVYKPLFDSKGECQCYVAVDISMVLLSRYLINFAAKFLSVFICFYLLFLIFAFRFTEIKLVRPVNTMARVVDGFAYNNEDARRRNVEKIREIDIKTGDEIENLYNAFLRTTEDSMGYVEKLRKAQSEVQDMMKQVSEMDEIAYKDALTGMKNRAAYEETVKRMDASLDKPDTAFSLVMIDINFLKKINDTYGHEFGDIYLINAAKLISGIFGSDISYRLGGDEFVLLFEGEDVENADDKLESFRQKMDSMKSDESLEPWEKISAAMGKVTYEKSTYSSMEEVLKEADRLMYENKLAMKAAR